jgi:Fe-S cluster biogenesis protein NfuA/nitrite reductase/ring-hydroxylating ferredoxin subunit
MPASSVAPPQTERLAPAPPPGADRIQALIGEIEALPDSDSRELMQECLYAVLDFYGAGLARILSHLRAGSSNELLDSLAGDDVVSSLLLIHGLHPVPLETRLAGALESVRPYMESHGGNIELASIADGIATLRLEGHCKTCPSSSVTLELAVRRAIEDACPDLDGLEVEGMSPPAEPRFRPPPGAPAWHLLGRETELGDSPLQSRQVNGARVLLCKVGGLRYAYRDFCPLCESPLAGAVLDGAILNCTGGHRFDVRRAGSSPDQSEFHLEPFPLVIAGGMVKVAVDSPTSKPILP